MKEERAQRTTVYIPWYTRGSQPSFGQPSAKSAKALDILATFSQITRLDKTRGLKD